MSLYLTITLSTKSTYLSIKTNNKKHVMVLEENRALNVPNHVVYYGMFKLFNQIAHTHLLGGE